MWQKQIIPIQNIKMSYGKKAEDGTMITQTITNTKIVTKLNLIKVEKIIKKSSE